MRSSILNRVVALTALLLFGAAIPNFAQDRSKAPSAGTTKYVVSAEAGAVNVVEGEVIFESDAGRVGRLVKGDDIKVGQKVTTSADGKAEILLNPGSYLRVGGNTSFEFESTSLENLTVNVHKGSAVFEVFASNDFLVNVNGPDASFVIVDSGVYRIDVVEGKSTFSVRRGQARAGHVDGQKLKGGRESSSNGNEFVVAKFDRDDTDDLDNWSRSRSRELARMVASLDRNGMRTSLLSSFNYGVWDMYSSFGLWVFDPFRNSYCFLPFGWGWSSPYGFGYGRYIGWYRLPPIVYYPPVAGGPRPTTPTGPGETIEEPRYRGRTVNRQPSTPPPYTQMEQKGAGGFPMEERRRGLPVNPPIDSGPIFIPAAPPSAPNPGKVEQIGPVERRGGRP